ncbi:RDD family protein [Stenotrophomonas sp. HITSZ_GD]|uniref:RDD family protein n=1 Tax=Stenotrophomonas sp. HITSZ_GD TaxID=3037248 RepID=UPI00240CFB1F|nr:RDD family protein [Stenotrophomonas sp. HITSZ_GD]MDG2525121.1 RDD family protein [Stenotrophomonas sp. HITSZ_GD]
MTQWFYADAAGMQQGPVEAEALLARYAAADITPASLVWREGLAGWLPLSAVAAELGLAEADLPAVETPAGAVPLPVGPADIVYAGFWRRTAANIIDGLAVALVVLPFTLPMIFAAGFATEAGHPFGMFFAQLGVQLFVLIATVLYFACFHASRLMASPGKLAVGIKVVRPDGQRLNFGRSVGRGFAYYLSYFTLYIGFLIAAFTERKQALHDLICDTLVVDRWAFTDEPQRQTRGLDVVSIVILAIYGLILLLLLLALAAVAAMALAGALH